MCPPLSLWWGNLFPACVSCQGAKGDRWAVTWLRPDVDDVEAWIACDFATGRIEPSQSVLDEALRRRVEDTLEGLGLNRPALVRERWLILRSLYSGSGSLERLLERAEEGPYCFLAPAMG